MIGKGICGVLSAGLAGAAYLLGKAQSASEALAGRTHGPIPPEACTPEGDTWEVGPSLPMSGGPARICEPGTRESALAWAEAISAAGVALVDEDFEEEGIMCLVAAGKLTEKVAMWGQA